MSLLAITAMTSACVETAGYPSTSYNGGYGQPAYYNSGYGQPAYNSGYSSGILGGLFGQPAYRQPTYYAPPPQVVTQTRYVPVPVQANNRPRRDSDGDGIPDRWDRDKNGDGIPDRSQRRGGG